MTKRVPDSELRRMWREAGGNFSGPNVEHGSMPETKLLPFLRSLLERVPKTPLADAQSAGTVNELAAWLIALEDASMYEPVSVELVERGRMYVRAGLTEKHSGDCTNQSHSCVVCGVSDAIAKAKQILAALPQVTEGERAAADMAWLKSQNDYHDHHPLGDSKMSHTPTPAEIQSGLDRQKWAEGLILQLPVNHDGRNSWLMNFGRGEEAQELQRQRGLPWSEDHRSVFPKHIHAAGTLVGKDIDTCAHCGADIRNEIHHGTNFSFPLPSVPSTQRGTE